MIPTTRHKRDHGLTGLILNQHVDRPDVTRLRGAGAVVRPEPPPATSAAPSHARQARRHDVEANGRRPADHSRPAAAEPRGRPAAAVRQQQQQQQRVDEIELAEDRQRGLAAAAAATQREQAAAVAASIAQRAAAKAKAADAEAAAAVAKEVGMRVANKERQQAAAALPGSSAIAMGTPKGIRSGNGASVTAAVAAAAATGDGDGAVLEVFDSVTNTSVVFHMSDFKPNPLPGFGGICYLDICEAAGAGRKFANGGSLWTPSGDHNCTRRSPAASVCADGFRVLTDLVTVYYTPGCVVGSKLRTDASAAMYV